MNKIAWRFMRACHKELTLCLRIGVTRPITKDFVGNLNETEYPCIISHLALQHTYYQCNVKFCIHMHKFVQYHIQFSNLKKKHVNCLWLSVEDESLQRILNIVGNCI